MATLPANFGVAQKSAAGPQKPEDLRMARLVALDLKDADSKYECSVLVARRIRLNEEIDAFLEAEERKAAIAVSQAWEQCKSEAREVQSEIDALHAKQTETMQRWNEANRAKSSASLNWEAAKNAHENLGRFASAKAVAAAEAAIEKARAAYEVAESAEGELLNERRRLAFLESPLNARLAALGIREVRLRAQVNGEKTYLDPQYGLVLPPGTL